MIQINIVVSPALAFQLEEWLCEQPDSRFCLLKEKDDQDYYTLQGFFPAQAEADKSLAELGELFPEVLKQAPTYVSLADKDWQDAYKAYLKPWHSRELHWVPVWERDNYIVPEGDVVLYFDAGMAFGTGAHETTRLCAERLLDYKATDPNYASARVIDAGCGSGILALSARLLGFEDVYGFDIDPEAIRVSEENRALNQIENNAVHFETADLDGGLKNKQADIVIANIQADVLMRYAELLLKSLKPGGVLILSGILVQEIEQVRGVFSQVLQQLNLGLQLDSRTMGEWADLMLF